MSPPKSRSQPLTTQVDLPDALPEEVGEGAWIEVIQRMDELYAELVEHQVALEQKNDALEAAYDELQRTHETLKQTQRQLIQAEKMASLGRLVAGVAHELNNPISFLQGNAYALEGYNRRLQTFFTALEELGLPAIGELKASHRVDAVLRDLEPLVEGTREGAGRVTDIVQSLLRFTTPQPQVAAEFDLAALVRSAVQWVCRGNRVRVQTHLQLPESLMVCGYEGLVHQVLVNLVQNAVDAVEAVAEPALWLTLQQDHQQAEIRIHDNGPGVQREHLARIFDPFFTTKQTGKGTGLGLYISYLLATEQCNGDLSVENRPGSGAEFNFRLPLQAVVPQEVSP
ncbi:MAG: ATP-binding protein [Pseudomonadota bacterium]|nr:ATP-binding protein [Pseudomonadota bacterium]